MAAVNAAAWIVLVLAGVVAVADWVAVWRRPAPIETVLKPLVLVLLIVVALVLDPSDGGQRAWFVVALVLSLAGDVFLLPSVDRFVPGLASFLLAHVAYIVGFVAAGRSGGLLGGVVLYLAILGAYARRIVRAVRTNEPDLLVPVVVYMLVIASMLVASYWHGDAVGVIGALMFVVSDSTLATDRFVEARRWAPLAVMITYHTAQGLLVLSVASTFA
jgi:uncharacterized membrane protein YhhN